MVLPDTRPTGLQRYHLEPGGGGMDRGAERAPP